MEAGPNNGLNNGGSTWVSTQPELQYTVNFTTAVTHYVWIRAYASNGNDNSIHAGLDGTTNTAAAITLVSSQYGAWNWTTNRSGFTVRPTVPVSSTGLHTFSLWMREDGMRVDRVVLSVFTNFLGNEFHIPNNGEQDLVNLGIPTMRNPLTAVTFYTGNQFQGSGDAGNQLASGSTIFYKKSTDVTWNSLPLLFFTNGVSNSNNKYYSVTLPANTFSAGDTVQYYFKIPYSDHGTTFVFGNDAVRFNTELESETQANRFSYTVRTPPTGPSPLRPPTGATSTSIKSSPIGTTTAIPRTTSPTRTACSIRPGRTRFMEAISKGCNRSSIPSERLARTRFGFSPSSTTHLPSTMAIRLGIFTASILIGARSTI